MWMVDIYLVPSHIYLGEAALAYLRTNDKIADVGSVVLPVPPGGRGLPRVRHGLRLRCRAAGCGRGERKGEEESGGAARRPILFERRRRRSDSCTRWFGSVVYSWCPEGGSTLDGTGGSCLAEAESSNSVGDEKAVGARRGRGSR